VIALPGYKMDANFSGFDHIVATLMMPVFYRRMLQISIEVQLGYGLR
jgi:hypothetical protein